MRPMMSTGEMSMSSLLVFQELNHNDDEGNIGISGSKIRRHPLRSHDRKFTSSLNDVSKLYSYREYDATALVDKRRRHSVNQLERIENGTNFTVRHLKVDKAVQVNPRAVRTLSPIQHQDGHHIQHQNGRHIPETQTSSHAVLRLDMKTRVQDDTGQGAETTWHNSMHERHPYTNNRAYRKEGKSVSEAKSNEVYMEKRGRHRDTISGRFTGSERQFNNTHRHTWDMEALTTSDLDQTTDASKRRLVMLENLKPLPPPLVDLSNISEVSKGPWTKKRIQSLGYPFKIHTPVLHFSNNDTQRNQTNADKENRSHMFGEFGHNSCRHHTRHRLCSSQERLEHDPYLDYSSVTSPRPGYTHRPGFHGHPASHPFDSVVGKILQRRQRQLRDNSLIVLTGQEWKDGAIISDQLSENGHRNVPQSWQPTKPYELTPKHSGTFGSPEVLSGKLHVKLKSDSSCREGSISNNNCCECYDSTRIDEKTKEAIKGSRQTIGYTSADANSTTADKERKTNHPNIPCCNTSSSHRRDNTMALLNASKSEQDVLWSSAGPIPHSLDYHEGKQTLGGSDAHTTGKEKIGDNVCEHGDSTILVANGNRLDSLADRRNAEENNQDPRNDDHHSNTSVKNGVQERRSSPENGGSYSPSITSCRQLKTYNTLNKEDEKETQRKATLSIMTHSSSKTPIDSKAFTSTSTRKACLDGITTIGANNNPLPALCGVTNAPTSFDSITAQTKCKTAILSSDTNTAQTDCKTAIRSSPTHVLSSQLIDSCRISVLPNRFARPGSVAAKIIATVMGRGNDTQSPACNAINPNNEKPNEKKQDWIVVRDYKSTYLGKYGSKYNVWTNTNSFAPTRDRLREDRQQEKQRGLVSDAPVKLRGKDDKETGGNNGGYDARKTNKNNVKIYGSNLQIDQRDVSTNSQVSSRLAWKLTELANRRCQRYNQAREASVANKEVSRLPNRPASRGNIPRHNSPRQNSAVADRRLSSRDAHPTTPTVPYRIRSADLRDLADNPTRIDIVRKYHTVSRQSELPSRGTNDPSNVERNCKPTMTKRQAVEFIDNVNRLQAGQMGDSSTKSSTYPDTPTQELLDYFWSYQGIGRQLLHVKSGTSSPIQGAQLMNKQTEKSTWEINGLSPLKHTTHGSVHGRVTENDTIEGANSNMDEFRNQDVEIREKKKVHLVVKMPATEISGED